jgi:hypothetical protein
LQVLKQWKADGKLTPKQTPFMADTRPPEELYNLQADPFELHNLAADETQAGTLDQMRAQLDGWIAATNDTGATPENPLPAEYDLRTRVDGWMTSSGVMTRQDGRLHMQWSGDANVAHAPWVVEGGPFELRLRMRSPDKTPEFFWGTVDNMTGKGNRAQLKFTANNSWQDVTIPFETTPENWLCLMGLDFGAGDGSAEIEHASLHRAGKPVRSWDFA